MSGCFGDIRGAECPAFSRARHAFRGAVTLYETFVCSEMGSVCEMMPYAHIDPATCSVADVLRFLWYILDSGSLPSTLQVYVAAIASFRSPLDGQLIDRHALVVSEEIKSFTAPACSPALGPWSGIKSSFTAITREFSIR